MIVALYGIFPFGQVIAFLIASAFAPVGGHGISRSILDTFRHQSLMARGEFNPSAAAVAINKAIQEGMRGKSPLDWGKIAYGLFFSGS